MWNRKRNKIIENVKIEKIWFGWIGIAHTEDGKTILVSGWVLPGMVVDVKTLRKKADFIKAQAVKIVESWKLKIDDLKEENNTFEINNTKVCKHNFIFDTDIFKWEIWWKNLMKADENKKLNSSDLIWPHP